jgi:Zn-dependent protease
MDRTELRDILISWLVLSLAFMIATRAISLEYLLIFLFIVGVSIITHEFAHREVARRLRFDARYQAWLFGLALALLSSFAGFIFAAPGAVVISPRFVFHETRERLREANFKISAAGPGINLILGIAFIILLIFFPLSLFYFAAQINIWLAIFNLLPFPPLDGSKIFFYNSKYWFIMFFSALGLFIFLGGF